MYVCLKNTHFVHIYRTTAYIHSDSGIYKLDETTSMLVWFLKKNSKYDIILKYFYKKLKLKQNEITGLIQEILDVNKDFLSLENHPNDVEVIGEYGVAYPHFIQISLTNRCVHKCIHCFKGSELSGTDMPNEMIELIFQTIEPGCKHVELTGGEPFLHNSISEYIKKYGEKINLNITTSGYNIREFDLEILKKINLIQVSLHGSSKEIHDAFVGKQGSFDKVTKNIEWLCSNHINVIVTRTLVTLDVKEIERFINLCIKIKVKRLILGIVLPVGRAVENGCTTDKESINNFESIIRKFQQQYRNIEILFDDEGCISNSPSKYVFHCIGGKLKWYISEKGDVFPCAYCQTEDFSIGNIKNNQNLLQEIIFENEYEKYNLKISENYNRIKYFNEGHTVSEICPNIRMSEL